MSRASESLMVAEKKDWRMSRPNSARVRGDSSMEWSLLRARSESVATRSGWICGVVIRSQGHYRADRGPRHRVRHAGGKDSSVTNGTLNNEGTARRRKNTRSKALPEAGRRPLNQQAENRFLAMPATTAGTRQADSVPQHHPGGNRRKWLWG